MPNNWKTYKLSDALEIKYGKDHKKVQDGTIPIYGTGGIMRYGNQALYDKETILIPRKGSLNNIFYLNEPFWSVDTIFWSKINEEVAFPKYLFYNLKVLDFASMDVGSAIPSLTTELLKKIEIELPSLQEQKSIASILSTIDDKIENNLAINKTLEEMAMALYKHWFVDFGPFQDGEFVDSELGRIPKGWEIGKLEDLLEIKYGKDHKKLEEGNIPVYGSGGIMRYVNESLYDKESILIPRKGTLSNLFYVSQPFWSVDTMFYSKIKDICFGKYIFYFLKSADLASMDVGSAVPSLTTELLKRIQIIIPPKSIVNEFNEIMNSKFNIIESNIKENQTLTQLRDSLLPKLISGDLRLKEFRES